MSKTERSIFEAVIEKPSPGERAAFLDEVCQADGVLRRGVDALLHAHDRRIGPATTHRPSVG